MYRLYPSQCRHCTNLVPAYKGIICSQCRADKRLRGVPETTSEGTDFIPSSVIASLKDLTPDYVNPSFLLSIIDRIARES